MECKTGCQQCLELQCNSNCKTCSDNPDFCLSCNNDHYLDSSSNSCIECISPCQTCSYREICDSCIDDYFLISNSCYECNKNCKTTLDDNCKCDTCEDGYYLENYQCLSDNSFSGNEQIENMINNIFEDLNINDIDDGNDRKISEKNLMILLTSAENQKITEIKK